MHPFFMRITIEAIEAGYRWVLETGPGHCLMESGRAPDLLSCVRGVQDAEAELGLNMVVGLNLNPNASRNLLTHPRFQR